MGLIIFVGLCVFISSVDSRSIIGGCELNFLRGTVLKKSSSRPINCRGNICGWPTNTEITVVCIPGYVYQWGEAIRRCKSSGRWTGTAMKCRKKEIECPKPNPLIGGRVVGKVFEKGYSLIFFCHDGLRRIGPKKTTCLQSGKWNNPFPTCERIVSCPDPEAMPNSKKKYTKQFPLDDFGPNDSVKFECHPGYYIDELDDFLEMSCSDEGKWEYDIWGTCTAMTCPPPSIPSNGWYLPEKDQYNYGDKVIYHCNDTYEAIGIRTLVCGGYGQWNNYEPTCKAIRCPDPSQPENGRRIGSSFFMDDTVRFKCSEGFTLLGSENRTCLPTAQWSGRLTLCVREGWDCPYLGTPIGGVKQASGYNIGDIVSVTCGEDFTLEGSKTRVCLKHGVWSGRETVCRYKDSYNDPKEAAILFNEKLDTIAMETSSSEIGSQLLGNRSLENTTGTGRALTLGYQYGLDLYLLVDVSGSIDDVALNISKEFCKAIVSKVGVSRKIDGTRIVIFQFAGSVTDVLTLQGEQTPEAVIAMIDSISKLEGSQATGLRPALQKVEEAIATNKAFKAKSKALTALILLTDGMHNIFGDPLPVAEKLKTTYETDIYTIGVGPQINGDVLGKMAKAGQFLRLQDMKALEEITQEISNGSVGYTDCGIGGQKNLPGILKDFVDAEDIRDWPWMAGLYYDEGENQQYNLFTCGASLIRPQWLLTAAHCFKRSDNAALWQAKMGSVKRARDEGVSLDISEIIIHPEFTDDPNERNDVALVKLLDPLPLTPTIRRVCLPDELEEFPDTEPQDLYKEGRWSVVTGWGDTNVHKDNENIRVLRDNLKFTVMNLQSNETCAGTLQPENKFIYDDGMYCAGDGKKRDSCKGDSGGPSVVEVDIGKYSKRVFQVGIVSWGDGCRQQGKYGFYTRVDKFLPWIKETVEADESE